MLGSSSSSSSPSLEQFFTFGDFDDTYALLPHDTDPDKRKRIKNPQLLLPILLFLTLADNQHLGILTNRTPDEREIVHTRKTDYAVADFVADVAKMGIQIPQAHIIFGGGCSREKMEKDWIKYEEELHRLTQELKGLSLEAEKMDTAETLARHEFQRRIRFGGKNYFITSFLEQHLDTSSEQNVYRFESGACAKENLVVGIVDDLKTIVKDSIVAGYFGIQASRGGILPGDDAEEDEIYNFYSDEYLIKLAGKIGLNAYVESLVQTPEQHVGDAPMMKIAALLYEWHAFPDNVELKTMLPDTKMLSGKECKQLVCMMQYIDEYANMHKAAHYNPMQAILGLDVFFIAGALDTYQKNLAILHEARKKSLFSVSMPNLNVSSPKKHHWFSREKVKSSVDKPPEILPEAPEVVDAREQNQVIEQRVLTLTQSDDIAIKKKALAIDKIIKKQQRNIWQQSESSCFSTNSYSLPTMDMHSPRTFTLGRTRRINAKLDITQDSDDDSHFDDDPTIDSKKKSGKKGYAKL